VNQSIININYRNEQILRTCFSVSKRQHIRDIIGTMVSRKRSRRVSDSNDSAAFGGSQDEIGAGNSGKKQRASPPVHVPERLELYGSEIIASDLQVQKHLDSHREKPSCLAKDDQSPFSSKAENVELTIDSLSLEKVDVVDTASSLLLADPMPRPSQRLHLVTPRSSMVDLDKGLLKSVVPREPLDISSDESDETILCTRPRRVSTASQKNELVEEPKTLPKPWRALFTRKWSRSMPLVLLFVMTMTIFFGTPTNKAHSFVDKDSVYVPGGGFSGFWFTLGRLRSIPNPEAKNFYCYSAGCLGVVATLSNYTMEEMYGIAYDVQSRWKQGDVDHFDVVETFLDDLLFGDRSHSSLFVGEAKLSRLNIITTVKGNWFGLNAVVRKPESLEHLHEMLLQTTWIPYATGGDLWLKDHMDGAFTVAQHPKCEHSVGIELNLDLVKNIVNVNLGRDKVEKFYYAGLALGL
jgi:hypothetical protein